MRLPNTSRPPNWPVPADVNDAPELMGPWTEREPNVPDPTADTYEPTVTSAPVEKEPFGETREPRIEVDPL